MLIDTHCHLDAVEFDADRREVAQSALALNVGCIVVPAVHRANFATVQQLSQDFSHCVYALGIHPMYVNDALESDLADLENCVQKSLDEGSAIVAIGEIGLDFFVQEIDRAKQEHFFVEQLKLAKKFGLPVILHVRRSVDEVLKYLRKLHINTGIAHAFNGSQQQAEIFIQLGFKLGFGGAMTYSRALNIRRLAASLPLEAIVLETDAPDIPPEWLGRAGRNAPEQLAKIAQVLAEIRGQDVTEITRQTSLNAIQALPKIAHLYTRPHALLEVV